MSLSIPYLLRAASGARTASRAGRMAGEEEARVRGLEEDQRATATRTHAEEAAREERKLTLEAMRVHSDERRADAADRQADASMVRAEKGPLARPARATPQWEWIRDRTAKYVAQGINPEEAARRANLDAGKRPQQDLIGAIGAAIRGGQTP